MEVSTTVPGAAGRQEVSLGWRKEHGEDEDVERRKDGRRERRNHERGIRGRGRGREKKRCRRKRTNEGSRCGQYPPASSEEADVVPLRTYDVGKLRRPLRVDLAEGS
jgi:hypothetical protein